MIHQTVSLSAEVNEVNDVLSLIEIKEVDCEFGPHLWEEIRATHNVQALSDLLYLTSIRLRYLDTGRRNFLAFIKCRSIDSEFGVHLFEEVSTSLNTEALGDLLMLVSIRLKALRPHCDCHCSLVHLVLQSPAAGVILLLGFFLWAVLLPITARF